MSWVFWSTFAVASTLQEPLWVTIVAVVALFIAKFLEKMEAQK